MFDEQPDWDQCGDEGGVGARLAATALCLSHTAERVPDAFDDELKRIGAEAPWMRAAWCSAPSSCCRS